jgi:hypothetical protein
MNYHGYTYHFPRALLWLWRLVFCRRQWHLWDEVASTDSHYFVCDACGEVVYLREAE